MTRSNRLALLLTVLALGAPASMASADCPSGPGFCAELRINAQPVVYTPPPPPRGGQVVIQIGPGVPPPPPPPVVIVRPAPPPPPPVVIVRPAPPPPPPVYVQPQPVYVQPRPVYVAPPPQVYVQPRPASGRAGIHLEIGGAGGGGASMGGFGGALRLRPTERFAVDLGTGIYGGTGYNGDERLEIPLTADVLAFVNPQHRAQFYVVGGVGASFAFHRNYGLFADSFAHTYTYVGGQLGAGVEWRLTRGFALNADFRGFLRTQVDDLPAEFVRPSTGETTRVSGGYIGKLGATFYF